jgi:transposase
MENEILNLEYRKACLAIKAINSSVSMQEAAEKLGVHVNTLYDILRTTRIKMKRNSCRIKPQKVTFRDANDVLYQADPI